MMRSVHGRLALMMLLQYAVWGFWLPVLARFLQAAPADGGLGFGPGQVGWILGLAGSIGAVTAPFVAGQIADRHFSTERFLAVLLLAGGVVKIITAYQTTFSAWLLLSILYSVIYTPTLALTNSLAFAHLDDPDRQFPFVRVWGTIGWIAASWLFPLVWLLSDVRLDPLPPFYAGVEVPDATGRLVHALVFSGVTSIGYAGFALFLPHTPPRREAVERLAFAKAFRLFGRRSFAVLVAASLPISVIHQIYFMQTAPFFSDVLGLRDSQIGPAMTIGQFAEIAVMAGVGLLLTRLGVRWVITIGALAYFLRYAVFSATTLPVGVIVASQALHGFCYACFFAVAYIYVNRLAEPDVRHSAQTVFGIIILGVGPVLAAPFLGLLASLFSGTDGALDYAALWRTLSVVGLVTAIGFAALFRDETAGARAPRAVEDLRKAVGS
ncbi:MAG TPA: MFS transporter [Thermoanaerobaculia bacterium]|nr:MFS transporter [Thermoanaerobaculia bacterium]